MARLLMLGTVNHPHVEHLALAMADRGFEVVVAGDTVDGLAPSVLPLAGIEVLPAPPGRRGSLSGAAAHVRWLRGLLRRLEPDVVQLVLKHMGVDGEDLGELPFPDRVHLVGHVEYERMAAYYRAADVCVS